VSEEGKGRKLRFGPQWVLHVKRKQFVDALRTLARAGRNVAGAEVRLRLHDGELSLQLAGCSSQVPAVGSWPAEVRFAGEMLGKLATRVPQDDPLPVSVNGDRLYLARFSVSCTVKEGTGNASTPVPELIPANAELFDILIVRSRCSLEEIAAAGAEPLIAEAEARLKAICAEAAGILKAYRVEPADIEALCENHIEDGSRRFRETDGSAIRRIMAAWELLAPLGVEPADIKDLMDSRLRSAWKR
jgi:hypothetical protein